MYCRGEVYPVETDERLCDILETGVDILVPLRLLGSARV